MRKISIVGSFVLMLTMFSGLVSAETVIDNSTNHEYLFTLASKSGTLEEDKITLNDVPLVVYFADRPVRKAGHVSLEKFVSKWDKGFDNFKEDPPTAELAIYDEGGDKHAVLIISRPEVKDNTISFKVRIIGEDIPKSFGHSTLFIDGAPTLLNGQITD